MSARVYRITKVLSAWVLDLPIGTNLGLFHVLWTLICSRPLQTRGACQAVDATQRGNEGHEVLRDLRGLVALFCGGRSCQTRL